MPLLLFFLAVAVFAQGTSEFVLAGLLPGIAADLGVTLGQAGLLTSAFALGMVIGAPTMAAFGRRFPPRWTLTVLLLTFIAVHVVGALAETFPLLLLSRVLAALANAGFLAVTMSTVALITPPAKLARSLAVILGGTTLALIAGVPLGAYVGGELGWRAALWGIVVLCAPATVAVAFGVPARPRAAREDSRGSLRDELRVLVRASLVQVMVLAVLVNAATFATFTYLTPLAHEATRLAAPFAPVLLAVFGVGAFIGVSVSGRYADRHWRVLVSGGLPVLALGWGLLASAAAMPAMLWILAFLLAALSFLVGSTLVSRVATEARDAVTMGGSYATVALNIGAMAGPAVGGALLASFGPLSVPTLSACCVAIATAVWLLGRRSTGRR